MRKEIAYVDQAADELCLQLVEGNLNLAQFTIIKTGVIKMGELKLESNIIGSSHLLRFSSANGSLHEVFACIDVFGDGNVAFKQPLKDITRTVKHVLGDYDYFFDAKTCSWREGEAQLKGLDALAESCTKEKGRVGLSYTFPSEKTKSPQTVVVAQANSCKNKIEIETAHSYPNEDVIVFTNSWVLLA